MFEKLYYSCSGNNYCRVYCGVGGKKMFHKIKC